MKCWKVALCAILCMVLFAAVFAPVRAEAAETVTVYLDPAAGDDTADGLTEAAALKTYDAAYDKVKAAGGGTIVLLSNLDITTDTRLPKTASDTPVVLTSKTGAEGITGTTNIRFNAPTTLEGLTVTLKKASSNIAIYAEGKKLTIGENVNSVDTDGYYFSLAGGKRWAQCSSAELVVQSGTWRNIYTSVYGYKSSSVVAGVTGTAKLTMTGGRVTGFITPSYTSSAVTGNVEIDLSNMQATSLYLAPTSNGTVTGNVNVTLREGAKITGSVFAGGLGSGSVTGNVNITIDGADTTGYDKIIKGGGGDYTGSVGSANITIKSGVVNTPITNFDSTAIAIPEGKTLKLLGRALTADTVQSAGTLVFEGAGRLTASAVTGTVNCEVVGEPLNFHSYVIAPAGSGIVFANNTVPENNGVWSVGSIEDFKGLVLTTTVDNISVKLYDGNADNAPEIAPVYTDGNDRYYTVEAGGKYKYVAKPVSGYSHYNIQKNLYITEEKANTKYILDVTPPERTTAGWDPWEVIKCYSDEAMAAAFPSSPDLWPEYAHLFTTPLFNEGRTPHRQTTQTEMMNYIASLDQENDNMYVYVLGKSAGAKESEFFDIPVIFYTKTDLSGASTWQEAAELVRTNGKLTFMYQAQIHSKEPGNGEAALAMLMDFDGAYGEGLLDNMNLCVLPRFNPWGAYKSQRTVYLNGGTLDANRDFMRLESVEVQLRNQLFNAVEPEVYYDSHECNLHPEYEQVSMRDVWISTNFTPKATAEFRETALTVCYEIFDRAEENNLTYGWYSSSINGYNPVMSTTNVAMRGSLVFLNESHGIWGGMQQIERRIMSHVSVVTAILDYVNENTAAVQKVVDDQRKDIVERGKTYEESDIIVLKSDYTWHEEHYINGKQVDTCTGEITDYVHKGKIYDVVVRSRVAPTAYVIPAGESWNAAVLEKLDLHGISYYEIPADSTVLLQQYTGNTTAAELKPEAEVTFEKGAYVMTMAQEDSYILAILMEPDVDDLREYESTFAQQGLIPAVNGEYPIYRYIQDLNADNTIDYLGEIANGPEGLETKNATAMGDMGKITGLDAIKLYEYRLESATAYTAAPAGATEIDVIPGKYAVRFAAQGGSLASGDAWYTVGYENLTECVVYLDGIAGSDELDGSAEATAVKTFEAAFRQLDFLRAYAAEGAVYQIVITGNVTITQRVYTMPSHDYPVVITGKTDDVGIIHNSDISATRCFNMGGDTTLENMTLNLVTRHVSNFMCAGGHKLVIESTVKTIANEDGEYFNFMGGSYDAATETTDVTILGGTWRNVYLGSYKQTVSGDVRGQLANCTVNWITPSYSGSSGDVYMELEDVTILEGLYCGNVQKGNVNGNVTVTLREGVTFGCFYAGSQTAGNVTGTVTVTVDGADLTGMHLTGKAKNDTGTVGKSVLVYKSGKLGTHSDFTEFADESVKVIRGDLNNDGNVSDADAMYLLRYTLFGDTRYPLNQGGDVNGDGNISDADAMYLLRYTLFGESRYPLH